MIRILICLLCVCLPAPAAADGRIALVIGNNDYQNVANLNNAENDARDIGAALASTGFEVTFRFDLSLSATLEALKTFRAKAVGADAAVLYYSGHGIEVERRNFMIPIDATLASARDVEFEAVPLETTMAAVEGAKRMSLVIIDACRNNPFLVLMRQESVKRSVGRGLAAVEPPGNTLVAYAARDGTEASDGAGRNSPYAAAIIKALGQEGLEIGQLFRQVRDDVLEATAGIQQPFVYGSLSADAWYFRPPQASSDNEGPVAADNAKAGSNGKDGIDVELTFWQSAEKAGSLAAFQAYLDAYPDGAFAALAKARIAALAKQASNGASGADAATGGKARSDGAADKERGDSVVVNIPKERQIFYRKRPIHVGDQLVKSWVAQRPVGRCYNISVGAAGDARAFRISFEPFSVDKAVVILAGERKNFSQPRRTGKRPTNYWGKRAQFVFKMRRAVKADDRFRICARKFKKPSDPNDRDDFMVREIAVSALRDAP